MALENNLSNIYGDSKVKVSDESLEESLSIERFQVYSLLYQ